MVAPTILRLIRLSATVCLLEAIVVVALAVVEVVSLDSARLVIGITTTIFFLCYAAGLALSARGLFRARSWTRAPLLLAQLIQIGLAWSFYGSATAWVSILLAIPAIFVAVVLVLPATAEILYGTAGSDDVPS